MSAPRIRPLARPTNALTPETTLVTNPSAIAGPSSPPPTGRRRATPDRHRARRSPSSERHRPCHRSRPSAGHALHGRHHDDGHQREQAEDDHAGREGRLQPAALELPTRGLKTTASTAANSSGSTISLTAPNAVTTMAVAATTPTKLQARTPSLGTERTSPDAGGSGGARVARHLRSRVKYADHSMQLADATRMTASIRSR